MSAQVAIVMGSSSDAPIMAVTEETLSGLGIEHETRVLSAHRTPDEVRDWSRGLAGRGLAIDLEQSPLRHRQAEARLAQANAVRPVAVHAAAGHLP